MPNPEAIEAIEAPETLIQRQLDAYNARDLEALLACYAPEAEQFVLHGARLAQGHADMRSRFAARFTEPNLHATLLQRTVMGAIVVDHERIARTFPEGRGTVEMLCVYEIADGLIRRASFATGPQVMETP